MTEMTQAQRRLVLVARARLRLAQQQGNPPPAGMSAQQAAERDMAGAIAENNTPEAQYGRMGTLDKVASGMVSAARGFPGAGEYLDEAVGAVAGPQAERRIRDAQAGFEAVNPNLAMAGQVGVGLATGIPLAMAAAPAVAARAGSSLAANVFRGTAAGVAAGATEGAISGYGRGNDGDRVAEAEMGAIIGGGLGGVVGAAAPALATGISNLARNVRGRPDATAARQMGASPEAAEVVGRMIEADGPMAQARIAAGGQGAMVADAGRSSARLLDAATQRPGSASQIASDAVESRAAAATGDMVSALDRFLGRPVGTRKAGKEIAQRTSAARSAAYDRAYAAPIDYSAPAGRKIDDVLSRIPDRIKNDAIREANEEMVSQGLRNEQIMARVADDGTVAFTNPPNVRQLDALKQALDKLGSDVDIFGRPTKDALRPRRLARELRSALGEAVPEYNRAAQLGGQKIAEDQALDIGRRVLLRGTTREDVADALENATAAQLRAARTGVRQQIDEAMANVRRTITDTNMDAREGIQVLRDLSSRANQEKMSMVLGDKPAAALLEKVDQAARAFELRARVADNSATAAREAMKDVVERITQPGIVGELLSGSPMQATRKLVQSMTNMTPQARVQVEDRILAEVTRLLTERRGPAAQAQAQQLVDMLARAPQTEALARKIGQAAGVGVAVSGQQGGGLIARQPTAR